MMGICLKSERRNTKYALRSFTRENKLANCPSVTIIGLGLMGGSLALALREARWADRLIGVDRDAATSAAAVDAGAIDSGTTDLAAGVAAADVVLLATPVRTILRLLPEVGRHARPGALIMDLGSTKQQICRRHGGAAGGLEPVGGHPMCGKEVAGFAAAEATLFHQRPFVLCPVSRTAPAALEVAPQPGPGHRRAAGRPGSGRP